jgi:DNA-binding beta-propeller fold protein YncE
MIRFLLTALLVFPLLAAEEYPPGTYVFPSYFHSYGIRKAGPTELFLFMGFKVRFDDPQGLAAVRLDSWDDPDEKYDDDELTVYGVNSGQNNIIFNSSMWGLGVYGLDGPPEQQLKHPTGICANSAGDVYVADTGNHRVVRLHNPGSQLEYVSAIGDSGSAPGQFRNPRQVAMDSHGAVYVSDSGNNRVQVFDQHGIFMFAFGAGDLQQPDGIAVVDPDESFSYRRDGFIVVIDSLNQRISRYDPGGNLQRRVRAEANAHLAYLCIDYYNQLIITDTNNHCLIKLDKELNYITRFGQYGDDDNQFISPRGVAIYRRFGQLFVAEESGAQYYWVGTDITGLQWNSTPGMVFFDFTITEPSRITADILDAQGNFVRRIADRQLLNTAGAHSIRWDRSMGRRSQKFYTENNYRQSPLADWRQPCPPGTYRLRLQAEATYSSRTYYITEKMVDFKLQGGAK